MIKTTKKCKRLPRDEFFGDDKIKKLTSQINRRTLDGFNYINIRDKDYIKFLKNNADWLDYIGITLEENKKRKTYILRWRS